MGNGFLHKLPVPADHVYLDPDNWVVSLTGPSPLNSILNISLALTKGLAGILLKVAYIQFLEHPED